MRYSCCVAVMLLIGCGSGADSGPQAAVDTLESGRVVVRSSEEGMWAEGGWTLELMTRIGSVSGESESTFGGIYDVVLGPDQGVYVLDAQDREVRVFAEDGRFVRAMGRPGEGPGEFESPYGSALNGEGRLWVADSRLRSYTVLSRAGQVVQTFRSPIRGRARGQLRFAAGRLWDQGVLLEWSTGADGSRQALSLGPAVLGFEIGDSLIPVDTVLLGFFEASGLRRISGDTELVAAPPFAPTRVWDIAPNGSVWVGVGDQYQFHEIRPSGDTVRSVVREVEPVPLSDEDAQSVQEWLEGMVREGFTADEVDVFGSDGRYMGWVSSPLGDPMSRVPPHITSSRLLGVAVDSLGVQYVELYRIISGDADG